MKKLFLLLAITATILTGCSKDNDSSTTNDEASQRRVGKITHASYTDMGDHTDGNIWTTTYEWDGNKIKQEKMNGELRVVYNYSEDKVSEILYYQNSIVTRRQYFTYNEKDQITKYTVSSIDGSFSAYANVSYNDNGEVSSVTCIDGNTTVSYNLTWNNGNITKLIIRVDSESTHRTENYTITYDTKKSYRHGLGIEAFQYNEWLFQPLCLETRNNPVSIHNDDDGTTRTPCTYTYDGDYVQSYKVNDDGGYHMYPEEDTYYIKYTNTDDPARIYNVTANSSYGHVNGAGEYEYGKTVKLHAMYYGYSYHFVRWSNGATDNPLVFMVTGDVNLYAIIEEN